MYACRDGHASVVQLLLEHKAAYDLQDQNGWTAIQYGSSFPQIVSLLESAVIRDKGLWHLFPPSLMEEFSAKFPNFYLDLCSYLAKYGDSPSSSSRQETGAPLTPTDSESPKRAFKTLTMESFYSDFSDIRPAFDPSLLFQCVRSQDPAHLQFLLDQQHSVTLAANSTEDPPNGLSLLLAALKHRPLDFEKIEKLVHILVAAGADMKALDPVSQKTCLHFLLEVPCFRFYSFY